MVQWLRLRAPNAGDQGSIPAQGTRFHILQLRPDATKKKKKRKKIILFIASGSVHSALQKFQILDFTTFLLLSDCAFVLQG